MKSALNTTTSSELGKVLYSIHCRSAEAHFALRPSDRKNSVRQNGRPGVRRPASLHTDTQAKKPGRARVRDAFRFHSRSKRVSPPRCSRIRALCDKVVEQRHW